MARPAPETGQRTRPRHRRASRLSVAPARLVPMSAAEEDEAVDVLADLLLALLAEDDEGRGEQ